MAFLPIGERCFRLRIPMEKCSTPENFRFNPWGAARKRPGNDESRLSTACVRRVNLKLKDDKARSNEVTLSRNSSRHYLVEYDGSAHQYGWTSAEATVAHHFLAPALKRLLLREQPRTVLDIGCGNGAMALHLRGDYRVTAFDASEDGILQANEQVRLQGGPSVRLCVASVYSNDLEDVVGTGFDAAYALEVVEHLYYPRQLFVSARKCLRPGGLLVVSTPYHGYLKNLALSLTNRWDSHWTTHWDGGHIKFFSRATLGSLAAHEGFELEEFQGVGRVRYLWKSMILSFRML